MSNSVWPHRWQSTRLHCPWDSPGKNTGVGCHFLLQCMKVKSESKVAQSYLILSDPVDCSLPGCSIHGILQARVLEWGAIASPYTCMSSTLKLTYVIFTTLWANYYYFYPHFTGEETGTKRLNNSSKSNANNWQNNLTTKLQLLSRKMHF